MVSIGRIEDQSGVPVVLERQVEYENGYFRVTTRKLLMPSGAIASFFIREEPDVAVCLPVTEDGQIILLKEYRPGPSQFLFEVAGGNVDEGESPDQAARREVLEETGYSGTVRHLATTHISAYSTAKKHIFIMKNARKTSDPQLETSEISYALSVTRAEFMEVIASGQLTDLDAALLCLKQIDDEG